MQFITTRDSVERQVMVLIGEQIVEIRKRMDHNLAVEIANAVGQLFKK